MRRHPSNPNGTMEVKGTLIREKYTSWQPHSSTLGCLVKLLEWLPGRYLQDLGEIVLRDTAGLTREEYNRLTVNGNPVGGSNGVYYRYPKRLGRPGRIDLFIDNIESYWPKVIYNITFMRELILSKTLFHEIAHHVDWSMRHSNEESEEFAINWSDKMRTLYHSKAHPISFFLLLHFFKFIRYIKK